MMKRLIITGMALLLLFCGTVTGEEAPGILTEFEDFFLRTETPPAFQGEKADGQPLFLFYPAAEGNVAMTAVNAVWSRREELMAPEEFSGMYRASEAGIRAQYESGGRLLKKFEVGEAAEREAWGMQALICDAELLVAMNETEITLVQRGMMITGPFGTYLFSLSAWSPELLEEATETLIGAISWK